MHAAILLLLAQLAADPAPARELFVDPHFLRGLNLTADRHPAPKVEIGVLQTTAEPAAEPPAWRIAQWATNYLLVPGACTSLGNDTWQAETPGKRVLIERTPDGPTRILLEGRGITEYGSHLRRPGEFWPHLLIEQAFNPAVRIADAAALPFRLDMRIPHCEAAPWAEGKLDPGLHTAQISAYWTVHNLNESSPDNGEMIWFGIPLFDARHDVPPPHYALDKGKDDATGKFICTLDGKRFWKGNTGDGQWRSLDVDLVPLLHEALAITQQHGYMPKTQPDDLALTSFNLGWEIPGPYDATVEIRGLSLAAVPKSAQ